MCKSLVETVARCRTVLQTTALLLAVFSFGFAGSASAAPAANLDQYRNGAADAPIATGSNWVNGNAGAENAHFVEGYSIPYRCVMTDLPTATTIRVVFGYDIKHSGAHAIDYLTYYQRVNDPLHTDVFGHAAETFNPLAGVAGVDATTTTFPFPAPTVNLSVDPDGAGPGGFVDQPVTSFGLLPGGERVMTLYGGTITNVQYDTAGTLPQGDLNAEQSEARIEVTFTSNSATAVLSWGGHIGRRDEWGLPGDPQSAGGISGSPYHMRLLDWNLTNLGNQDRSLSAVAVFVPCPTCSIAGTTGPLCPGSAAQDYTVSIDGTCEGQSTITWSLSNNTSGASFNGGNTGETVSVNPGSSCVDTR